MKDSERTLETHSSAEIRSFWGFVAVTQDRIAQAFGVFPVDRGTTVSGILARAPNEATGYWLQLMLAMGIATLGLVLRSTAVVIGAMLISPLMGPIIELGMGLAAGSPLLVLRSVTRTVFCAILLFAVLCFLALGYSRAHVAASEATELGRHGEGLIRRLTRGLRIVFGMKYGGLLRVLMLGAMPKRGVLS